MKKVSMRIVLILSLLLQLGTWDSILAKPLKEIPVSNVKIEQWVGRTFTFMALPTDQQADGYEMFTVKQESQGFQGDRSLRIPYTEHVGKKVTVNEIVAFPAGDNQQEYMVYMTVQGTGEKLVGRSMRNQLEGLVLTADLEQARRQFLGKTIYPKFRELSGLAVSDGMIVPASVPIKIGDPVTVIDVYIGNQLQQPIWLVVSVKGEKAVLPIAYSWTNAPIQSWGQNARWQDFLFMEDPRISLGGTLDLWNQIENGNIEEGMTKEQVYLSWGKPVRTDDNDSIWIYGTNKLSFHGEILYSIEEI
ncbi:hypothetical protein [Pelosinus sp. sgz500959]|uniref:hypothetical protein n=1 Tax=Pelosinus sp. sgz500959 TaxID=3242472 RepID=UPI003670B7D6